MWNSWVYLLWGAIAVAKYTKKPNFQTSSLLPHMWGKIKCIVIMSIIIISKTYVSYFKKMWNLRKSLSLRKTKWMIMMSMNPLPKLWNWWPLGQWFTGTNIWPYNYSKIILNLKKNLLYPINIFDIKWCDSWPPGHGAEVEMRGWLNMAIYWTCILI